MTSRARDDWIDRAREVRIEDVIEQRSIALRRSGAERIGPCPQCGGDDRFAINIGKQVFNCRGCGGKGGDAIALVEFLDSVDFLGAVETLAGPSVGAVQATGPSGPVDRSADRSGVGSSAKNTKRPKRSAPCAIATRCGARRCGCRPTPSPISHGAASRSTMSPTRAACAFTVDARSTARSCPASSRASPTRPPERRAASGAVRLPARSPKSSARCRATSCGSGPTPRSPRACASAKASKPSLAASQIAHKGTLLRPAWACGCANNIGNFLVLPGVEHLTVIADADANGKGQSAARVCAKRWADAGREVEVLIPDMLGDDFNDLVRAAS